MGWKWQRRFIHIWSGGEKFENFWNSLWQPDFLEGGCQVPSQTRLRLDMQSSPGIKNKLRIIRKSILTLMSTRLLRMVTSSLRSDSWSPCSLHPTTVASSTMLVRQSPPCPTTMWQCFHEFDSFRSRPCFFSCLHKHGPVDRFYVKLFSKFCFYNSPLKPANSECVILSSATITEKGIVLCTWQMFPSFQVPWCLWTRRWCAVSRFWSPRTRRSSPMGASTVAARWQKWTKNKLPPFFSSYLPSSSQQQPTTTTCDIKTSTNQTLKLLSRSRLPLQEGPRNRKPRRSDGAHKE